MAAQIRRRRRRRESSFSSVLIEASSLAGMVLRGVNTLDEMRKFITITPADQAVLRKSMHALDLLRLIENRQAILQQFERLIEVPRRVSTRRNRVRLHSISAAPGA